MPPIVTRYRDGVPCGLPVNSVVISGIPRPFPLPLVVSERKTRGEGANLVKSPDFGPLALAKNTKIFRPPSAARCAQNRGRAKGGRARNSTDHVPGWHGEINYNLFENAM